VLRAALLPAGRKEPGPAAGGLLALRAVAAAPARRAGGAAGGPRGPRRAQLRQRVCGRADGHGE